MIGNLVLKNSIYPTHLETYTRDGVHLHEPGKATANSKRSLMKENQRKQNAKKWNSQYFILLQNLANSCSLDQ